MPLYMMRTARILLRPILFTFAQSAKHIGLFARKA
jgi:hypothetical protein